MISVSITTSDDITYTAGGEKEITKITTARSRMYSDVGICRVDAAGHRDEFETLRVTHAADATDDDIRADIDAAVAATQQKPNYRIYDETGGGVTEDIYAASLEDAIEAGRTWIEAGDWASSDDGVYRTITLECGVREIVRYRSYFPFVADQGHGRYLLCGPQRAYLAGDSDGLAWADCDVIAAAAHKAREAGRFMTSAEMDDWVDELATSEAVYLDWEPNPEAGNDAYGAYAEGEIDEDATTNGDRHDCSGTFSDEIPACELSEDGEHDWRSPFSLVGGIKENPGFWSGGGTITTSKSVCACCGQYRTETDKGSQCQPSEAKVVTEIEPADDASKAWLMRRLSLPDEIEIDGVTVALAWDESGDITDDDSVLGTATHTVPDLDEGESDGPCDGETFTIGGVEFRLGVHDYETNDDETTWTAAIYRVLP